MHTRPRHAFTLIELLVVIFIIIVLVAITVPALSGVRNTAKATESKQLLAGLAAALQSYEIDTKRVAGYFSARDMGSAANAQRGFSNMQNIMLDLAGGYQDTAATGFYQMGPTTTATVYVNPNLVGATNAQGKQYFTPTAKNWRVQSIAEGARAGTIADHERLPELVDAFGQPILAWCDDPTGPRSFDTDEEFAREDSGNGQPANASRYYLAGNRAFLDPSVFVGVKRAQHTVGNSYLGETAANLAANLGGLLGNPASPGNLTETGVAVEDIQPTTGRGSIVLHAAGRDGIFLSKTDKGAAATQGGNLDYGLNFRNRAGDPLIDSSGKTTSIDPIAGFDDIIQATGS